RDIHEREQGVKKELNSIADKKKKIDQEKFDPDNPADKKAQEQANRFVQDETQTQAQAEADLAKRAEDLVEKMKAVQRDRTAKGDKDTAERLKQAIKVAEQGLLPKNIREVEKELKNKAAPSQKAMQQQEKNLEQMEKLLAELEGKKEDVAERL